MTRQVLCTMTNLLTTLNLLGSNQKDLESNQYWAGVQASASIVRPKSRTHCLEAIKVLVHNKLVGLGVLNQIEIWIWSSISVLFKIQRWIRVDDCNFDLNSIAFDLFWLKYRFRFQKVDITIEKVNFTIEKVDLTIKKVD